jgi:hypothetical protein
MKEKIEAIIAKQLPGFWSEVSFGKHFLGEGKYLAIKIAASDYNINDVRDQKPQAVSLLFDLWTLELHPQVFGGNGGRRIYRQPNLNDPAEKYLAMKGENIPFRTPQKNEAAVLKAIEKFCINYKELLRKHRPVLEYQELVDYDTLLK